MIEHNKQATEQYYKYHEDMIVNQLESRKNIQTQVIESNKNS